MNAGSAVRMVIAQRVLDEERERPLGQWGLAEVLGSNCSEAAKVVLRTQ